MDQIAAWRHEQPRLPRCQGETGSGNDSSPAGVNAKKNSGITQKIRLPTFDAFFFLVCFSVAFLLDSICHICNDCGKLNSRKKKISPMATSFWPKFGKMCKKLENVDRKFSKFSVLVHRRNPKLQIELANTVFCNGILGETESRKVAYPPFSSRNLAKPRGKKGGIFYPEIWNFQFFHKFKILHHDHVAKTMLTMLIKANCHVWISKKWIQGKSVEHRTGPGHKVYPTKGIPCFFRGKKTKGWPRNGWKVDLWKIAQKSWGCSKSLTRLDVGSKKYFKNLIENFPRFLNPFFTSTFLPSSTREGKGTYTKNAIFFFLCRGIKGESDPCADNQGHSHPTQPPFIPLSSFFLNVFYFYKNFLRRCTFHPSACYLRSTFCPKAT